MSIRNLSLVEVMTAASTILLAGFTGALLFNAMNHITFVMA